MSPSPDPEQPDYRTPLMRMRAIFHTAAEKSAGPGKDYFGQLSATFDNFQAAAQLGDPAGFKRAELAFHTAKADLEMFAQTDFPTAKILSDIKQALGETVKNENIPLPKKQPEKIQLVQKRSRGGHWQI